MSDFNNTYTIQEVEFHLVLTLAVNPNEWIQASDKPMSFQFQSVLFQSNRIPEVWLAKPVTKMSGINYEEVGN